jgi:hypothetical protein
MTKADYMRCLECQALNDPGSVFCARCGSSLRWQGQNRAAYNRRRRGPGRILLRFILALALIGAVLGLALVVLHATGNGQSALGNSSTRGTLASTSTTLVSGNTRDTTSSTSGETASATSSLSVIRPESSSASSSLTPTNANNFRPQNLSDDSLLSVWSEGAEGVGLGEWVRFEFGQPFRIGRIEIANGNQKSKTLFAANPRVRSLRIEYANGATQLVELRDTENVQYVNTFRNSTEWIRLTIVSVYSSYTSPDTSLSEVRFYAVVAQQ